MVEKILTLHPQGKSGISISKAIQDPQRAQQSMAFKELTEDVRGRLGGSFDGSISWYVTAVKLDLEARGVIERIPNSAPQRLRLVAG